MNKSQLDYIKKKRSTTPQGRHNKGPATPSRFSPQAKTIVNSPRRKVKASTMTGKNKNKEACATCGKNNNKDDWIRCDGCDRWFHGIQCENLDSQEYKDLEDDVSSPFFCNKCIRKNSSVKPKQTADSANTDLVKILEGMDEIKKTISNLASEVRVINQRVKDLDQSVKDNKTDIANLSDKFSASDARLKKLEKCWSLCPDWRTCLR